MPQLVVRGRMVDFPERSAVEEQRSKLSSFTRLSARWLMLLTGLMSWGAGASAVTIAIDEFQHDTVMLPFVPQQGTLFLCEGSSAILSPVTCEAPVSDTIVFLAGLTSGTTLLESELSEVGEPDAPGDRLLLIPFPAPFFSIGEPELEGANQTLLYTPVPGQPGFALVDGKQVSYAITSDEVPEPATWLLITVTLTGLLGYERLQKRVRRPSVFGARPLAWGLQWSDAFVRIKEVISNSPKINSYRSSIGCILAKTDSRNGNSMLRFANRREG